MPFINPKSLTSDTQYLFLRKREGEAESGAVTPLNEEAGGNNSFGSNEKGIRITEGIEESD
jgi:hypothetical protein